MMKDNIFSICLGNNSNTLKGCKNDSLIFFNYLLMLHQNKNLKENWIRPCILKDNNVAVNNIKNLISNCTERIDKILLFYSGHGYHKDKINIYSNDRKIISSSFLIKNLNSVLKNDICLYIILDCCYSGSFQIVPFDKIKKIKLISSTLENQKSTESVINKNNSTIKDFLNADSKENITVGTFTFHFVNLLIKLNINCIDNFKLVFYDEESTNIWFCIGVIGKHFPKIIW